MVVTRVEMDRMTWLVLGLRLEGVVPRMAIIICRSGQLIHLENKPLKACLAGRWVA